MDQEQAAQIEVIARAARDTGAPVDQCRQFVTHGYVPLPWQWKFHAAARECDRIGGPVEVGAGGARGPGKSHATFSQVGLDDCQRYPGLKFLFLRQTAKAARESFEDLIAKTLRGRGVNYDYNRSDLILTFPNESKIILGGYANESDIEKYVGIEYDGICVEELNQLTENRLTMLKGSLRSAKPGWRPRLYVSFNPGGRGHVLVKTRYVDPYRAHTETNTRFVPSTYRDNPYINQEYIDYLEGIPGTLGKAWRDGDFDVFEGMAFPAWSHELHVIPYSQCFTIPAHWPKWRAVDWGYSAPFCCLWLAKNPDNGRIYVYRELYQTGLADTVQARTIRENTPPDEQITITYADPSMWHSKNMEGRILSTADEYAANGVVLTKADNSRRMGKRKVDRVLGALPDGLPGLQIFENCVNLIRTMPLQVYSPTDPEDVDSDGEDHAYDTLKYGLSNYNAIPLPSSVQVERKRQMNPMLRVRGVL